MMTENIDIRRSEKMSRYKEGTTLKKRILQVQNFIYLNISDDLRFSEFEKDEL